MLNHILQFPSCTDEEAISVACLDLHYYVTVHENMQHTMERKETHMPVALNDLQKEGGFTEEANVESMFIIITVAYYVYTNF